jgi:8-amino-7-oxononanoate synthase
MGTNINHTLSHKLQSRAERGLLRKLRTGDGLVDLCSNDYLGLARDEKFKLLLLRLTVDFPDDMTGATGSRLLAGNTQIAEGVEAEIAKIHKAEAGLIFNSGYDANLGLFGCIADEGDTILYDELVHASIHDGLKLSKANNIAFKHNDLADLEDKLKQAHGQVFVSVESVYSMDGDFALLEEIAVLCELHNAALIVDEAHATGFVGETGLGLVNHLGIEDKCFARLHTFGKALASHGAIVLGSNTLRNYLTNYARPFIYSTALPPHAYRQALAAYWYMLGNHQKIEQLYSLIDYYREKTKGLPYQVLDSPSAIQGIIVPGNVAVRALAQKLEEKGFDTRPIVSPTVPKGAERIRICLHSFNTAAEIDRLVLELAQ